LKERNRKCFFKKKKEKKRKEKKRKEKKRKEEEENSGLNENENLWKRAKPFVKINISWCRSSALMLITFFSTFQILFCSKWRKKRS